MSDAIGRVMPTGAAGAAGSAASTGSSTGRIGIIAISPRAAWRTACAAGSSGSTSSSGTPASACSRSGIVSGTLAEQRHVELVGQRLAAALAEDREALRRPAW